MSTHYNPKPTPVRAGSLDAFTKPSVVLGKRIERKAPHGGQWAYSKTANNITATNARTYEK